MIPADILFLGLAGVAFLGFVIDSLFHRFRVTSVLPLMLLGVFLVVSGLVPTGTIGLLNSFIPYVSALTVAFILFHVGLEIRFRELFQVVGRATAYTLAVQTASGIGIGLLAYATIHWSLFESMIFGFALSGPSSISVPVLVRLARMPDALRTSLLFESVISDVLQLLVPIVMIGFLATGAVSAISVTSTLLWDVLGSAAGGIVAAVAWLVLLDRLRRYAVGYTWTLTITMVLATYGAADRVGMSPAIVIFVFGLVLGNAALLDFRGTHGGRIPGTGWRSPVYELRRWLRISTRGLDIPHILQVQKEVSFFASSFFFVYIGLLFEVGAVSLLLVVMGLIASGMMLALRYVFTPLLANTFDTEPRARKLQRGLVTTNISRGLAAAVVATIPQSFGIVIPGFLDGIFLAMLFSNVVATIGVFVLYRSEPAESAEDRTADPYFGTEFVEPMGLVLDPAPPTGPGEPPPETRAEPPSAPPPLPDPTTRRRPPTGGAPRTPPPPVR